ncbi:MAG: response regulator transcription factor [Bacteroidota bacterium]
MIRVLIADDHQVLIDGIRAMLERQEDMDLIDQALTGTSVFEILQEKIADVLILDLDLPEMDGIEVCKKMQSSHPKTNILILSMHGDSHHVKTVLNHGATGYVLKNTGEEELLLAIRKVYAGERYISQSLQQLMLESMLHGKKAESSSLLLPRLTRREKQVLGLIVEGHTNAEIADILHISIKTVESHRTNLLDKLNARNTASLVRISMERGLV